MRAPCTRRIFAATRDAFLIALDAKTGRPCADFGANGRVDLNPGAGPQLFRGEYGVTSAPEVIGDRVVVGALVADNVRTDAPSGVVRAFDARSGGLVWAWDLAPPGYDYATRPKSADGYALGTPNVWAPMSSDAALDLVFVPTGNPAPDLYRGGDRADMDYYGSSVVALRAATGEVVWRFQTVHHDLWDYDVPAQPTLVDLVRDGERIPALVQGTKMGLLFVLHRETGEPIFGVEERPVPQGGAPGETLSPTQPFPLKPPPLVPLTMAPDHAWGLTPWDRGRCREKLEAMRSEGIYTPIGLDWTLLQPFPIGGVNWGGLAVDPERQLLVVNTNVMTGRQRLVPRAEYDALRAQQEDPFDDAAGQPQLGTPYAVQRDTLTSPSRPSVQRAALGPAHGRRSRIGGDPLAAAARLPSRPGHPARRRGRPAELRRPARHEERPRLHRRRDGRRLPRVRSRDGRAALAHAAPGRRPGHAHDLPRGGRRGRPRQFVVIAAGGHWGFHLAGQRLGDALVAFALPRE